MSLSKNRLRILTAAGLLAAVFGAVAAAGDAAAPERVENKGKIKIVLVDQAGDRHEETLGLDWNSHRPFLGVRLEDAAQGGARVEAVIEETAAARAGLRVGDVIVGFDGESIDSPWELTRRVLRCEPGQRVDLDILREGALETLRIELGERTRGNGSFTFDWDHEGFAEQMERLGRHLEDLKLDFDFGGLGHHGAWTLSRRPLLGVELVGTTPELREHLGGDGEAGVLVGRVLPDSPAEIAGVRVGDLIVGIDGEPVGDAGALRRALRERRGQAVSLDMIRDGAPVALTVALPAADEDDEGASPSGGRRIERRHAPHGAADRT